jgi:hypothetical protein
MDEEILRRIDEVLADFDGKETAISAAGRENTRTVNRVARIAPLRRVSGETTFRRNVSRYHVEGAPRDLLIGAERAGGGVWRLIARWEKDEAGPGP